MLTISIIMTTYNGAKFLSEQLDSFVTQSLLPQELVVVDDFSQDATLSILERFKDVAPFPVKIIQNQENIGHKSYFGFTQNFETAALKSTGDVIFFSDQDDVWFKQKLAKHIKIYEEYSDVEMIVNNAIRTKSDLSHHNLLQSQYGKIVWHGAKVSIGCCFSVRRSFLNKLLPFPKLASHDVWMISLSKILNNRYDILEPLQFFRRSANAWSAINESSNSITVFQCYLARLIYILSYPFKTKDYLVSIKQSIEVKKEIILRFSKLAPNTIFNFYNDIELLEKRIEILNMSNLFCKLKAILNLLKHNIGYTKKTAIKDFIIFKDKETLL